MIAESIKVSFNLPKRINDKIKKLSQQNGVTKSDMIRKSIQLMDFYLSTTKDGEKLIVVNSKGEKKSEIVCM